MGRKTKIAVVAGVVVLVLGAVGAYAYDSSQKDKIADGVTIGGVDVGGMNAAEAEAGGARASCSRRCATRCGSASTARAGSCSGEKLKVHADVDAAVEEAVEESRDGGLPGRLVRYVSGGERRQAGPGRSHLLAAGGQPLRPPGRRGGRPRSRRTPTSNRAATRSKSSPAENGRKLRDNLLTSEIERGRAQRRRRHTIAARIHSIKPEVTADEVAAEYPSYLTLDRVDLHPAPLEAPEAGQDLHRRGRHGRPRNARRPLPHPGKGRKPVLARARTPPGPASLAGQVIPPGPEDPIKARWMGIFEGAGIHGTEET